jgi:nitrite reductase (NADH) small subunit
MTNTWIKVCSVTDVPENGGTCVKVEDKQIAIFNFTRTGKWYATDNMCPHKQQMILSRGMIGDMAGEPKVACPFHKKTFSLETGKCLSGEDYCIENYAIKVEGQDVFITI